MDESCVVSEILDPQVFYREAHARVELQKSWVLCDSFWRLKKDARTNRKVPTISEAQLWHELRDKKLAGLKFRRQHTIHPFIVDFFCPAHKLIIEVDGDIHELP